MAGALTRVRTCMYLEDSEYQARAYVITAAFNVTRFHRSITTLFLLLRNIQFLPLSSLHVESMANSPVLVADLCHLRRNRQKRMAPQMASGKRHENMERRFAIALPLTGKRRSLMSFSGILWANDNEWLIRGSLPNGAEVR